MNLGLPQLPEWVLKLIVALALTGAVCVVSGLLVGLYVIVTHLCWVP